MLSLVCVYSAKWLLETIFEDNFFAEFIRIYTFLKFCGAFLLISCMSMFSLMWYTQQDQNEIAVHQAETLQLAKDAELYKLRHQLQPHFLFNSLNSISALTASQPEKARYMIQQLSDFLRVTLKQDEKQWSNIDEEMQYLQLYLDIEKVRFGHRLQTDIIKNDNTNDLQIPSFLLQPIVENAIKFGLYDTTDNVIISIHINKENQSLFVKIENPFDAETAQTIAGTGFGLSSIRRRLYLLFARNDLLKTTTEKQLFTTTITIPQNYESRNN